MGASGQKHVGAPSLSEVFAKFRKDGRREMKLSNKPELAGTNISARDVEQLALYTFLQKRKVKRGDVMRYKITKNLSCPSLAGKVGTASSNDCSAK